MIFKKVLTSLAALSVVGGTGTGIYYSLKEVDSEKSSNVSSAISENFKVTEITKTKVIGEKVSKPESLTGNDNSNSNFTSPKKDSDLENLLAPEVTSLVQIADSLAAERQVSIGDVNPTGSEGEESDEERAKKIKVASEDVNLKVQPQEDSNLGLEDLDRETREALKKSEETIIVPKLSADSSFVDGIKNNDELNPVPEDDVSNKSVSVLELSKQEPDSLTQRTPDLSNVENPTESEEKGSSD